jgi:hypothetical protein
MKDSERHRLPVHDEGSAPRGVVGPGETGGYAGLAAEQALDQAARGGPVPGRGPQIPLLRN